MGESWHKKAALESGHSVHVVSNVSEISTGYSVTHSPTHSLTHSLPLIQPHWLTGRKTPIYLLTYTHSPSRLCAPRRQHIRRLPQENTTAVGRQPVWRASPMSSRILSYPFSAVRPHVSFGRPLLRLSSTVHRRVVMRNAAASESIRHMCPSHPHLDLDLSAPQGNAVVLFLPLWFVFNLCFIVNH